MCWLDKISIKQILKIRNKFHINTFIETGVYKGINVEFHSQNFKNVYGCDISDDYLKYAYERTLFLTNVKLFKMSSPNFLKLFLNQYIIQKRNDIIFIFLDAHFYDSSLKNKWVVLNELKALKGFNNCVICIHDFDVNGLGHCVYNGDSLNWKLVKDYVFGVNPSFNFYVNNRNFCDIYNSDTIKNIKGVCVDDVVIDAVGYANSTDEKRYRGMLYCVPGELSLDEFKLEQKIT